MITIKELLKEIKGVFKPPQKKYYFGKLKYGTPYFWPWNFCSTIFKIRKLKRKEDGSGFSNLPMVRRNKDCIFKLFGNYYFLVVGWPIAVHTNTLGWKDKYNVPQYGWSPSFKIYFFGLQFCIFYTAPKIIEDGDDYLYWEMILWWLYYSDKDINIARDTWGWVNGKTKESTWNKQYCL